MGWSKTKRLKYKGHYPFFKDVALHFLYKKVNIWNLACYQT